MEADPQDVKYGIPDLSPSRGTFVGGATAGLLGGIAFGAAMLIVTGSLEPLRLLASGILGHEALAGGGLVITVGLAIHLAVSAAFGVVFAAFLDEDTPRPRAFTAGLLYAIAIWAVMTFAAVPFLAPRLQATLDDIGAWWFVLHLLYGTTLLLAPELKWQSQPKSRPLPRSRADVDPGQFGENRNAA